eukprot:6195413-Pleurochrysis_carterae.AAC.3
MAHVSQGEAQYGHSSCGQFSCSLQVFGRVFVSSCETTEAKTRRGCAGHACLRVYGQARAFVRSSVCLLLFECVRA